MFYNGSLISRVDDTRLLPVPFNLKDGVFHTVTGDVDFVGGTVNLSVDGNAIFANLAVPGLAPFEHRNGFAGFTGGRPNGQASTTCLCSRRCRNRRPFACWR